jgi:hypothetical protein
LGAAAQIVKALAIRGGVELRSHREPRREVIKVAKESKVDEIRLLMAICDSSPSKLL